MFQPVGSQPPSVYWRRRVLLLAVIALVIALIVLTVSTLAGGDGSPQGGGRTPGGGLPTSATPRSAARSSSTSATGTSPDSAKSSGSATASAMPVRCALASLQLSAKTGDSSYRVGTDPLVELQVVNVGSAPCTRDLSDKQIELRVYNGTSRVWGSHDCAVQPGESVRTLAVGKPYLFQIKWTGLTSSPQGCEQGTRQRVGAGSYTLYASLSGRSAKAAQFDIS